MARVRTTRTGPRAFASTVTECQPPPPILPLELHFQIIDIFASDKDALKALSKTCRAWAGHCRSLLFSHTVLRPSTLPRFAHRTHSLGAHIRSITLLETRARPRGDLLLLALGSAGAGAQLPNLRSLTIAHMQFGAGEAGETQAAAAPYARVAHLALRFCEFGDTEAMCALLAHFTALDTLEVLQCRTRRTVVRSMASPPVRIPEWDLRFLAIDASRAEWLARGQARFGVAHLRITALGDDSSVLNTFLKDLGAGLHTLEVCPTYRNPRAPHPPAHRDVPLDIRPCAGLTQLIFSERATQDLPRSVLPSLRQANSPHLTAVELHISLTSMRHPALRDTPLSEVDARLRSFAQVRLVVHDDASEDRGCALYDEAVVALRQKLPALNAAGVLGFVHQREGGDVSRIEWPVDTPAIPSTARLTTPHGIARMAHRVRQSPYYVFDFRPTMTARAESLSWTPPRSEWRSRRGKTRTVPMKVLVLGYPRTGTSSMRQALQILGYDEVYHMESVLANPHDADLWVEAYHTKYVKGELVKREKWDEILGHCEAATDAPPMMYAEDLIAAYPEAKVILTLRDPAKWWKSFSSTIGRVPHNPAFALAMALDVSGLAHFKPLAQGMHLQLNGPDPTAEQAQARFVAHYDRVRALVPKDRLLEFDAKQGWQTLCPFLGVPIPDQGEYPYSNDSAVFNERATATARAALRRVAGEMVAPVLGLLAVGLAVYFRFASV
ncbi:unnamed protein product [Mycena citricolor]|uniref:Uncharacterized protein n=1 Tax=Mycena citricolor TaxID=2018698 RepID=A0AAD2JX51_9AGAR|nr:unnamed protein product [Mycena citricolor]